ncbi:MAG: DUF2752 domain-containing protein [Bacteroidaceae bacterium]|nr:DUF2752 domain-containing protein [Bacteroidaceae bacterium]
MARAKHPIASRRSLVGLLFVLAVVGLYYVFDPAKFSLFPSCLIQHLTGWACPTCGAQRGLHALLHGEVAAACGHNFLLPLAVIYAAGLWVLSFTRRGQVWVERLTSLRALCICFALAMVWMVVRNIYGV